jgi:capsular exopolysaccharide synthesis family protein
MQNFLQLLGNAFQFNQTLTRFLRKKCNLLAHALLGWTLSLTVFFRSASGGMIDEKVRTWHEISPAENEHALTISGRASVNNLSQPDLASPSADDEPNRPTASKHSLYLHAFRRHWAMALTVGLICAAVAAIPTWLLTTERYTAIAVLRIATSEKQLVFQPTDRGSANDFDIYKGTQQQLLTNDIVLTAALRKEEVAHQPTMLKEEDPVRWLSRNLRVDLPPNSEIMRVSLTTPDPDEAALLVGAIVDAYMNEVVDAERRRQQDRVSDLDRLYVEKETEMRTRRTEFKQLAEQLGTGDTGALALKQQIALQQYAEARNDLSRIRSERQRAEDDLQGKLAWIKIVDSAPKHASDVDLMTAADPALARLSDQIAEIDERLLVMRGKLKEPLFSSVTEEYRQVRKGLVEKSAQRQEVLATRLQKAKRENQEPEIAQLQSRIEMLKAQEKAAAKDLEEQRIRAERFGNSSIDVEMMRSELQYLEKVLAPIADEREKLRVELRATPRIAVFQPAVAPRVPDDQSRLGHTLFAGIASLVGTIYLILAWDVRKERINSLADLSRGLGLTVVGTVPPFPQKLPPQSKSAKQGRGQKSLHRAVDVIAARLFLRKDAEEVRVVMVSSATQAEGKTTLAVQLATRLARSGRPTLLVDYDLQNPSLHDVFDVPQGPGVSECLQGRCDLNQVAHPTNAENLAVITAGDSQLEALGPLANGAVASFFRKAREEFAFIVVDGSPILPVIDGLLVSQHADTVVLSVRRDTSRGPEIRLAAERLSAFGSRKHVVVLNGSHEQVFGDDQQRALSVSVEAVETTKTVKTELDDQEH